MGFHFIAGLLEEWNSGPLPVGTQRFPRVPLYSRSTGIMEPKVPRVSLYSRSTGIMEPWATGTKGFPTLIFV